MSPPGLIVAAPSSGSGKTVLTLGLLRAVRNRGKRVSSAKVGPDYIDPAFHAAATGRACENIDPWAMRDSTKSGVLQRVSESADLIVCEGVMGLFDGATVTVGSTADVAAWTGWPVVLVVDVRAQAASAAAIVRGFSNHRSDIQIGGVIFNKVGSDRHGSIVREAMQATLPQIPVLGCVPRNDALELPSRHLGLVQAGEHEELENFLETAARHVADHVSLQALQDSASPLCDNGPTGSLPLPPLGQRIAVARDRAFAFCYDHVLQGWRDAGADISFFSPLGNEGPATGADAVYLPGGYPELNGERLAAASGFLTAMQKAAERGAPIYGECGGYMVLGETIVDSDGRTHKMTGLLPLETSFAERSLHLGYRRVETRLESPVGPAGSVYMGHEFHYSTAIREDADLALFRAEDAYGKDLSPMGMSRGNVAGSYCHLIDQADV